MHHHEKCLFKGILNRLRLQEYRIEILLDHLRHGQGMEDRATDSHRSGADEPAGRWIWQEIVRKQRVNVANRVAIEPNAIRLLREHLDSRFVIEDHLSFLWRFSFSSLSTFDEVLGLEQGIGIPLQAAGVPGKIDQ